MSYTCASHTSTQLKCFHHCLLAVRAHRLAELYWYWSDLGQETLSRNSVLQLAGASLALLETRQTQDTYVGIPLKSSP